jgi:hypothetical protein
MVHVHRREAASVCDQTCRIYVPLLVHLCHEVTLQQSRGRSIWYPPEASTSALSVTSLKEKSKVRTPPYARHTSCLATPFTNGRPPLTHHSIGISLKVLGLADEVTLVVTDVRPPRDRSGGECTIASPILRRSDLWRCAVGHALFAGALLASKAGSGDSSSHPYCSVR